MLLSVNDKVSLTLPNDWDYEVRETNVALYRTQDGRGALNISSANQSTAERLPIKSLLEMFGGAVPAGAIFASEENGEVAYMESLKGDRYWRHWVLRNSETAVFVSYNCREDQVDSRELEEVAQIVKSIGIQDSG